MSNLPLNPLRTFSVASRHVSFSDAARTLGVTQVAVSRQVAVLEKYLDVRLFNRDLNSVSLTETGLALSLELVPLFEEIESSVLRFRDREKKDIVSLFVYPTFCKGWLLARMPEILGKEPKFAVRFDTRVAPLDFRKELLNVAIQLGNGEWPGAKSRLLFPETLDAVCSAEYAEKITGAVKDRKLPADATLLHAKYRRREWPRWADLAGWNIERTFSVEFQSSILCYEAAQRGLGLSVAQLPLISEELLTGKLVRPFDAPHETGLGFYIVWPTITSVSKATKMFIDRVLRAAGQPSEFNTP